jgi:hypothetical protein
MKLKRDPFPLIFAHGDATAQLACLEFFDLADAPQGNVCLVGLLKQQRADGAFPSQFDPEAWGMLETVRHTLLLLKVGMPATGVNVRSAVQLVLRNQNPDGGWCENPALEIPPQMNWLSNEHSITWLTADAVDLLRQTGSAECPECQRAVAWLRAVQAPDGGWPSLGEGPEDRQSDPDATAQITFLMGELYGEEDAVYLKGKSQFEHHLDRCAQDAERGYCVRLRGGEQEPLDAYHLSHLLLSWWLDPPRRIESGYDVRDPRVRRMMGALIDLQREDGGWRPFFAKESLPVYTFLAVKVLTLSKMLGREGLKPKVEAHAV